MSKYENELKDKWEKIDFKNGGSLKLTIEHPLDWFVQYITPEIKSLVVISGKPVNLSPSRSIDTFCGERKDGSFAISFTLTDSQQEDVFITMASDIIEFSNASTPEEALKKLTQRYAAWKQLLDRKHNDLLGLEEQKGLIGELLFLKDLIEQGKDPKDALEGWAGPDSADQDFSFQESWYEIKTTGASSSAIDISSVEQLDNCLDGELVVFRVDKCAPAQQGSFTLYGLVHNIQELINSDIDAENLFALKLASAGYIDLKDYNVQYFDFSSKQSYIVNETFPRLRRDELPVEITNITYQISLPTIAKWKKQG